MIPSENTFRFFGPRFAKRTEKVAGAAELEDEVEDE